MFNVGGHVGDGGHGESGEQEILGLSLLYVISVPKW